MPWSSSRARKFYYFQIPTELPQIKYHTSTLTFAIFFEYLPRLCTDSFLWRYAARLFYIPEVCRAVQCVVCDFPRTWIARVVRLAVPETALCTWRVGITLRIKGNSFPFSGFFSENFGKIFRISLSRIFLERSYLHPIFRRCRQRRILLFVLQLFPTVILGKQLKVEGCLARVSSFLRKIAIELVSFDRVKFRNIPECWLGHNLILKVARSCARQSKQEAAELFSCEPIFPESRKTLSRSGKPWCNIRCYVKSFVSFSLESRVSTDAGICLCLIAILLIKIAEKSLIRIRVRICSVGRDFYL